MARTPRTTTGFASALRMFCGVGRRYRVPELAKLTEIHWRTIKSYLAGERVPSWDNYCRIVSVLGADFANEVHAEMGLGGMHSITAEPITADEYLAIGAEATARVAWGNADGKIDHREAPIILPFIERLLQVSPRFAHLLRKKRIAA